MLSEKVKNAVRVVKDFPKKGILFRDITPVLGNYDLFKEVIDEMEALLKPYDIDVIAGLESRGFFFASPLAERMKVGFVPVRKPGKLPYETYEENYSLEYGSGKLCIHTDAIKPGQNVAVIDDVLATGGTLNAAINLVEKFGITPKICLTFMEIEEIDGRSTIKKCPCEVLMKI
ncbi:MAG: adenine phosphoribosyltransferase, partial [Armatimonadetes bacterium]|nr:adenine phosphoribosyltransferase [Candidatus Hippobium faecium]